MAARAGAQGARAVAPWFPGWAREFAEQYFAGTTCVFVLHGNVHDLTQQDQGRRAYGGINEFLATQLFGKLGRRAAARPEPGATGLGGQRRRSIAANVRPLERTDRRAENLAARSRHNPGLLDKLIQRILMEEDPARRISLGVIFDLRNTLFPRPTEPDGRRPGRAAGAAAVMGAKPVHQAA